MASGGKIALSDTGHSPEIRAAATLVILRGGAVPAVLMGQRGAHAAFMPSKFVFPGGAIDAGDHADGHLDATCARRLELAPQGPAATAIVGAALRELAEETGLRLRNAARLQFIFRAITPPGRSRRFDARFLMADAADLDGNDADFTQADQELSYLQWVPLPQARALDLPFITEVVLAEVAQLARGESQQGVPFFDNSGDVPTFRRLT
jgi:8-oxo-dGTP pyrophosphatase MutT (NUDIX family)